MDEKTKKMIVPLIAGLVVGLLVGFFISDTGLLGEGIYKRSLSRTSNNPLGSGSGGPGSVQNTEITCNGKTISCPNSVSVTNSDGSISTVTLNLVNTISLCSCSYGGLANSGTGNPSATTNSKSKAT